MLYIGIDPGKSGAIAVLIDIDDDPRVWTFTFDNTERDIDDWLCNNVLGADAFAFLERVHAMPKQGVKSSFTFGQNYGFLRGILIAHGFPFEEVSPQRWQKAMGCLSHGDKNVTKAKAQQLFPAVKVTHAIADALLIAEYCRRQCRERKSMT